MMDRDWVVNERANPLGLKISPQLIPASTTNGILMVDMFNAFLHHRQRQVFPKKQSIIQVRQLTAPRVFRIQVAELHAQDGRLQLVQTGIHAG